VRNYLIENFGIKSERLEAKGYGEAFPIADNTTAEGRQRNRRVELSVYALSKK
jgi:OOP family OmpA-OmpF porin